MIGVAGLGLIIFSEILQKPSLRILGIFALAVVFVVNSRILMKRIENLENGNKWDDDW